MPASDALIGEALKPSPYAELSTKYEELSTSYEKLYTQLGERLSVREIEERGWPLSVEEWATKYQLLSDFRAFSAYDAQEARLETELARAERDAFKKAYAEGPIGWEHSHDALRRNAYARYHKLQAELKAIEPREPSDGVTRDDPITELAKYRALRTKYCG